MYKLYIPVINRCRSDKDLLELASDIKRTGADRVFLVFKRVLDSREMLEEKFDAFMRTKKLFNEAGLKVSAWVGPSVGYGGKGSCDNGAPEKYTRIVTDKGRVLEGGYCPLDENFVDDFLNTLTYVAKTGVEEILFEDDFTLTGGKMFHEHGCCCEKHLSILSERLCEKITREFISEKLYAPDGLKYRQEFLKLMGETLKDLASKIEKCIHAVNPKIRIGLCANGSAFKMEGVTIGELSKITAGNTTPFIRMTGAPYWEDIPTFAGSIESIRLQTHWLSDCGSELICEGDVYPRPRHWIPAAYLENYDMILRADGKCDGILKYMTDYTSKATYEKGYIERHIRNKSHYEEVSRRFAGKESVGLNIVENINTFETAEFGDDITRDTYHDYGVFQPYVSQWFAMDNSLPTAYGRTDCASLVFGENARYIDENTLKNGVVIDALAAKILMEKGIDVGIESYKKIHAMPVEYFRKEDDYTVATANPGAVYYDFTVSKNAVVMSDFLKIEGKFGCFNEHLWDTCDRCPACYFYENKQGHKFLVYSFVAEVSWAKSVWNKGLFRSYYRQAQLVRGIEMLQGRRLPAICMKNPELYILCKKDENSMAVGMWNLFADEVITPEIILDSAYSRADFYNCTGKLSGDRIVLDNDILPYSFAFFTLYK